MINFYETSDLTYNLIFNLNATSIHIDATSCHPLKTLPVNAYIYLLSHFQSIVKQQKTN
jgi:hypothetical protein